MDPGSLLFERFLKKRASFGRGSVTIVSLFQFTHPKGCDKNRITQPDAAVKKDLMRWSETSDLKDAVEMKEEEVESLLIDHGYSDEKAKSFIHGVKRNPFNDWIQWR